MSQETLQTEDATLNPQAATFEMPSQPEEKGRRMNGLGDPTNDQAQSRPPTVAGNPRTTATTAEPKSKSSKKDRPQPQSNTTAEDIAEAGRGVNLTGAELKKQKAAEKAARRAEKVAVKGEQIQNETQALAAAQVSAKPDVQRRPSQSKKDDHHHKRRMSGPEAGAVRIPLRPGAPATPVASAVPVQPKSLDKRVPLFSHLYPSSIKSASLATAGREIHPAVLTLGLQLRDYIICGANARTVATLLVLKKVIRAYATPPGIALSRHLAVHLSHQISYLTLARPLGVAQGNSIRWLKKLISQLDPDLAEQEAKTFICNAIDAFVRERVTLADEVIAKEASSRIEEEGEVILTYGKSSVVEKTLLQAFHAGKKFKVVVADSRPLFEGKNLARSLIRAGMAGRVVYTLLSGIADAVEQQGITKCFLGASAMLGNGMLSSRAGTALVACMVREGEARGQKTPVVVLCESIKFTARVALDSITMNEAADPDVLVEREDETVFSSPSSPPSRPESSEPKKPAGGKKKGGGADDDDNADDEGSQKKKKGLEGWRDQPNLYLLHLMYDITPPEYLDIVITELGSLPPSAVPVVNAVHGGDEQ